MDITYDEEHDIGYIQLQYPQVDGGLRTLTSKDEGFNFDYNSEGELIGIEFMSLKHLVRVLEATVEFEI